MSNIPIKIIILLLTFIGVVTFILVYIEEVAPPKGVTLSNEHYESAEEEVNEISSLMVENYDRSVYDRVMRKLEIYKKESFISEQEYELLETSFVKNYVPVFYAYCQDKFSKSVWKKQDLDNMSKKVGVLQEQMAHMSNVDDCHENLSSIIVVIDVYNAAKQLVARAKEGVFTTVEKANSMIQNASTYISYNPLCNCEAVVSDLGKVKTLVGLAHYNSVERLLENKLGNYKNITREEYKILANEIDGKIVEYKNNRSNYGANPNLNETHLYNRFSALNEEALQYYDKKDEELMRRERRASSNNSSNNASNSYSNNYSYNVRKGVISVDLNNAWLKMNDSPHSGYDAYSSFINKNKPKANAYMSFDIKGVSSFAFYVRSDGEECCDYVIVGLDYVPSTTYNDFSTKGNAQSGSTFYSYQRVEFNNLNKNLEYTIHVIYRKDAVINRGTDSGYILLPRY